METDIRYYRRRACEELSAASRAVTPEARERRLQLVEVYLDHLKALNAPSPFDDQQLARMYDKLGARSPSKPAFGWAGVHRKAEHA